MERSALLPRHPSLPRLSLRETSSAYEVRSISPSTASSFASATRTEQVFRLRLRARRLPHPPRGSDDPADRSDAPHARRRAARLVPGAHVVPRRARLGLRSRPVLVCGARTAAVAGTPAEDGGWGGAPEHGVTVGRAEAVGSVAADERRPRSRQGRDGRVFDPDQGVPRVRFSLLLFPALGSMGIDWSLECFRNTPFRPTISCFDDTR